MLLLLMEITFIEKMAMDSLYFSLKGFHISRPRKAKTPGPKKKIFALEKLKSVLTDDKHRIRARMDTSVRSLSY